MSRTSPRCVPMLLLSCRPLRRGRWCCFACLAWSGARASATVHVFRPLSPAAMRRVPGWGLQRRATTVVQRGAACVRACIPRPSEHSYQVAAGGNMGGREPVTGIREDLEGFGSSRQLVALVRVHEQCQALVRCPGLAGAAARGDTQSRFGGGAAQDASYDVFHVVHGTRVRYGRCSPRILHGQCAVARCLTMNGASSVSTFRNNKGEARERVDRK